MNYLAAHQLKVSRLTLSLQNKPPPVEALRTPRDGKIVGFAKVDGRDIGLCVNDFTVKGASTLLVFLWGSDISK